MDIQEREYFLSRILAGYTFVHVGGKRLKVHSPTLDLMYEANEIYREVHEQAREEGLIEDEECLEILINEGKFTLEDEKTLFEVLPKHIDYWLKELYNTHYKTNDKLTIRKYLKTARDEQSRLMNIRRSLDQFTAVETANFSRYQYIIENSTYFEGKLVDWSATPINKVIELYNRSVILPECIREISHTTPWSNHWVVCKANMRVFEKAGIELNISQQLLLLWSKMYDNIAESPDCPPDDIVNDDDTLDGWLLLQKEKRVAQAGKPPEFVTNNAKIANAENVYLIAQTVDDARRIDELNNPHMKAIKNSRLKYVNKVGKVDHINLPDVRQDAYLRAKEKHEKK